VDIDVSVCHPRVPVTGAPPGDRRHLRRPDAAARQQPAQQRDPIVIQREIAGERVVPFCTEGAEGFSIDYPDDWEAAERMAAAEPALLPAVEICA
jgi:hypothetical protein